MAENARPVALITGGARGIGRGCAYALCDAGYDIVLVDLAEDADAGETLAGIAARGGGGALVVGDIADLERQDALLDQVLACFGSLDCLVNNAGVSVRRRGDLLDVSVESFDRCLNVNLRGPFFLTQRVARHWLDHPVPPAGPGRCIVTISSSNAQITSPTRGEYCLSKAGLSMMVPLFTLRLAEAGIAVYEVRPGIIRTPMTAVSQDKYDAAIAEGLTPIARWGEAENVGRTVATMATGGLPFTLGQAVCVDGGLSWRHF